MMETNIGYDNWYIPESAREEGKPIVLLLPGLGVSYEIYLPQPRWLEGPLRYYQSFNVWTCYHWTGFWRFNHGQLLVDHPDEVARRIKNDAKRNDPFASNENDAK